MIEDMKPLRDQLVQSRLDEDEMQQFNQVKELLGTKSNSDTIRAMMSDELMVDKAKKWKEDDKGLEAMSYIFNAIGKPQLALAVAGITDSQAEKTLYDTKERLDDTSNLMESILAELKHLGTNINQVAHVLNAAKQEDPADEETWNWVNGELYKNQRFISVVKNYIYDKQVNLGLKEKDSGTHVSRSDASLPV